MKRYTTLVLALVLAIPATARAQSGFEIAGAFGRDFHDDAWFAAGHLRIPLARRVEFRPGGTVELRGSSPWDVDADLAVRGPSGVGYLGGGVGLFHRPLANGLEEKVGFNAFFGFSGIRRGLSPYLEFRWSRVRGATLFRPRLGVRARF